MVEALRSEFRKLYTVRSSYVIFVIALALTALVGGFAMPMDVVKDQLAMPSFLADRVIIILSIVSLLVGVAAILQFSHEYRYNTITYALTSARSRTKLLLAKVVVLSVYAAVFTLVLGGFALVALLVGLDIQDKTLASQVLPWGELLWKGLFVAWGYAMIGLILVGLARNQVFGVATYLAMPMIVEPLLALALKDNAWYLPFMAMNAVTSNPEELSSGKGALVVLCYVVIGWAVSWALFLRRDAN